MNVSRTSAAITPKVFSEVLQKNEREFLASRTRVEPAQEAIAASSSTKPPATSEQTAPTGPPQSFGPSQSLDGSS